jgi:hypothetical protein
MMMSLQRLWHSIDLAKAGKLAFGPSRHFAGARPLGHLQVTADIKWHAGRARRCERRARVGVAFGQPPGCHPWGVIGPTRQ